MLLMSLLVLIGSNGVSANWLSNMPSFVSIPDEYKKYVACSAAVVGIGYLVKYTLLSGNNKVATENDSFKEKIYLPLFYSPLYNISFFGIEKLHSFDSQKYGRVIDILRGLFAMTQKGFAYHTVQCSVSDEDLKRVHSEGYLQSLNSWIPLVSQWNWTNITEIPLPIPNFIIQKKLAQPMKYAVQGTIEAAQHALAHGVAINVGGGYHHAKPASGGGFCAFNDWAIAAEILIKQCPTIKILYLDLDAHQGNGLGAYKLEKKREGNMRIIDLYTTENFPYLDIEGLKSCENKLNEHLKKTSLNFQEVNRCRQEIVTIQRIIKALNNKNDASVEAINYRIPYETLDKSYLVTVEEFLKQAIKDVKPDIIFYNAGTDCFKEDPLGQMHLKKKDIIERDKLVFEFARENHIPICMATSGGYTEDSAGIIADSIFNLHARGLLTPYIKK